jgi:peptidylprolyl isomerase
MKKIAILFALVTSTLFTSCKDDYKKLKDGLYADIETSKGNIIVELEYKLTPVTVASFVTLAEGTNTHVSQNLKGKKVYDGLKFHRVLDNFMIQGGDPNGDGSGDAGYKFKDEFTDLKFDKGGILAMANSGPNTNGSQFFITHVTTPWLDGKHTIFGHVVENNLEVVNQIKQDDEIKSIKIIRKGADAEKFDAVKVFDANYILEVENQKKQAEINKKVKEEYIAKYKSIIDANLAKFASIKKAGTTTNTGISYIITKKGIGGKPTDGSTIKINYAGYFEDGTLFDSNIKSVEESFGKYNQQKDAQQGYTPIPFQAGRKDGMIPGFIEAIEKLNLGDKGIFFIPSKLGYGEKGAGNGFIPPNSNLIFELELLEK